MEIWRNHWWISFQLRFFKTKHSNFLVNLSSFGSLCLSNIFYNLFFFLNMHIAKPKAGILWGTETSKQRLFLAPQQVKKNITSPLEILQEGKAESSTSAIAVAAVEEINDLNWWMELMPRSQCVPSALQVLVQSLFWGTNFKTCNMYTCTISFTARLSTHILGALH